jgi:glycerol-3-phosphate O-acyltransferase
MSWMRTALLKVFALPVSILVRSKDVPADLKELGIDPSKPIVYLLPSDSVTDQLALAKSTSRLGLPTPNKSIQINQHDYQRCYFLKGIRPIFRKNPSETGIEKAFTQFFQLHREHEALDLQIVPVYITWGRAPERSKPDFTDLIVDNATPSWLRKLFIVLFLGRDNFINYSPAVSSREMANLGGDDENTAHKLIRLANFHFHRKRQAMTGPTLLDKLERNNAVLGSESVKRAMAAQASEKNLAPAAVKKEALGYLEEISADYREGLVRFGDRLLTLIWNKIYNGISVGHAQRIRELANAGHEIVYIPCHRSHMDYMLLTYVIYHEGLVTPHIAAGVNLNFWPFGGIFRRSGAFFLRRSFAGKKLYTAVFREYLELLFNKGYSVKFFPEGGRSRTGRLIPPKTGMLAMTVQAVLKGLNRPVSIVPVYIGYENVMEVKSYQKELKGSGKKKESPLQILKAVRKLKNYGHGFVNFGAPITVNQYLDKQAPQWREEKGRLYDKKPSWLTPVVNDLAENIMTRINTNAAINGMALVSLCLLSSKTHIMGEQELRSAIERFLELQRKAPFSKDITIPDLSAAELLESTLSLQRLTIREDKFGKLISPRENGAVLLTYYRNNIIHLFALPGLILTKIFCNRESTKQHVLLLVASLYPLLQKELFLHLSQDEALAYTAKLIESMQEIGLLRVDNDRLLLPASSGDNYSSAWLLSRCMQETFQRYAVVLTILHKRQSVNRTELEKQSKEVAERLSALYGISSPEFYDKNVFASFTVALKENAWVSTDDSGNLCASEQSASLRNDVFELIWPEIAQHLENFDV